MLVSDSGEHDSIREALTCHALRGIVSALKITGRKRGFRANGKGQVEQRAISVSESV